MSPPFQGTSAPPGFSPVCFPPKSSSGMLAEPNHSENVQPVTITIKVQSGVGPKPVVRCGLRPFQRLLVMTCPRTTAQMW